MPATASAPEAEERANFLVVGPTEELLVNLQIWPTSVQRAKRFGRDLYFEGNKFRAREPGGELAISTSRHGRDDMETWMKSGHK